MRLTNLLGKPCIAFILTYIFCISSHAGELDITAEFHARSASPTANVFKNTTPNGGYCVQTSSCGDKMFSISLPMYPRVVDLTSGVGFGLTVPYAWQDVQVTHPSGIQQTVQIRITGMGGTYSNATNNWNHSTSWSGGNWLYAPSGCSPSGMALTHPSYFRFFWHFRGTSPCTKIPQRDIPNFSLHGLSIMYELRTPNPLQMISGEYTGNITYTLGPNGDFRFGTAEATDPSLTLNFKLTVGHLLVVRFPANAKFLALQPQGGWSQWLNSGEKYRPKKLLANQDFFLSASTKFKMKLECQYLMGDDCGMKSILDGRVVAAKTMISLNSEIQNEDGGPVNRHHLSRTTQSIFEPTRILRDNRAKLHFEVDKDGVDEMIDNGGGTYRGNVTILWDVAI